MKGATYKRCTCPVRRGPDGRALACRKKHGSWFFAHDVPAGDDGRRHQLRVGGFASEREAREAMQASLAGLARGERVVPGRQRVSTYLAEWLAGKSSLRASTLHSYRDHVRLYLSPGLGYLKLTELHEQDVGRLYAAMRELGQPVETRPDSVLARLVKARTDGHPVRPLSAATMRRVHATLLSALNTAVRRKLIAVNPARHVELPKGLRPRAVVWTPDRVADWRATGRAPAVAVWTAEQTGRFLDAAAHERLYPLFHLIAYRGLRRGEAVGLRWVDVDLDDRMLRVTQQVVQLGWRTEIGPPKTSTGERTISLDDGTTAALRRWRTDQVRHRAGWGENWVDSGLVFTRENGAPLHPDLATDAFARTSRRAGLPPIRLHDLRHTAASLALQAGVPMKVVSEQLGHSSMAITADTYTSVLPAVARAAAEAVAGVIPRQPRDGRPLRGPRDPFPIRSHAGLEGDPMRSQEKALRPSLQVGEGGPRGGRTHNPRIKSPLLCQLS